MIGLLILARELVRGAEIPVRLGFSAPSPRSTFALQTEGFFATTDQVRDSRKLSDSHNPGRTHFPESQWSEVRGQRPHIRNRK
jgi:hypothetical protein